MPIFRRKSPTYPFNYKITRTDRKTIAIQIKSGKVEIKSPQKAPEKLLHDFIKEKTNWIQKRLTEQEEKLQQRLVIKEGALVYFLGHPRTIQVIISSQQKVTINEQYLCIYTRQSTPEKLEKLFNRWLTDQAREYMTTQTIKTARLLNLDNKLAEVTFRKTKTKWGHCSHDGIIQYNWLAMMAPKPVIDYLIAHETSHLLHMNHSKAFWATVERLCPDYKNLKNWFKHNGHRLWTEA